MSRRPTAIYYLHPLMAGRIEEWGTHFQRIRDLGFTSVLLSPPFLPGRSGDLFLVADHARLHPDLGEDDALPALRRVVKDAAAHGLDVMLDLIVDRVAVEAAVARGTQRTGLGGPPDPRHTASHAATATLDLARPGAHLVDWWQAWLAEWLDAGIVGFRCDAAHAVAPSVWASLIGGARTRHPDAVFMASTAGASAPEMAGLAGVGFDLATCASWQWDFRQDWLNADTAATAHIAGVLAMPELPFGARLAGTVAQAERAIGLATALGQAWLMPMGFEYGARARLDRRYGRPGDFAALAAQASHDLTPQIVAANARCQQLASYAPATLVSAPNGDVAMLLRTDAAMSGDGRLILLNTRLDRHMTADPQPALLLRGLAAAGMSPATLAPAEAMVIEAEATTAIVLPPTLTAQVELATNWRRIGLEAVTPSVDGGRFPVKLPVGSVVDVACDVICDGHETVAAAMRWKAADEATWHEVAMKPLGNDRWQASFTLTRVGRHLFNVAAWSDRFAALRSALQKLQTAGKPYRVEQQEAVLLIRETGTHRNDSALLDLADRIDRLTEAEQQTVLLSDDTLSLMTRADLRPYWVTLDADLAIDSERRAAGFSSWYEMFPRSQSGSTDRHGTFDDVIARLPAVQAMGFDTLYFPPIHPIGKTNRKGRNNSLTAGENDPGSPYAIGSDAGGHDAIHPELGTLDDFRRLIEAAASHGLEIALDFAIQCSPDHPWLREHKEWFEWRPDGSIKFAENPPKKYEDIVNVDFYADGARPSLWVALRDVVQFWVDEGVRTFRVDNPHTKPFPFWEWMIGDIRARHPDVIFLAEAFTRPKVMYRLAKVGFSQSYTYFTWRNSAWEMREYLTELARTPVQEFFRPHFFVNTPDINPAFLHHSGRPGFLLRAALAATLSGLWGVYSGFELCDAAPLGTREEYLDSEKYEIRRWDHDAPGHIRDEITRLNQIRMSNAALQSHLGIRFLPCTNDTLLCYIKATDDASNIVLTVVSFDPHNVQQGDLTLRPQDLGLIEPRPLPLRDLFRNIVQTWEFGTRTIRIDPADQPFMIWRVELESGQ